jgi:hypothetical protein
VIALLVRLLGQPNRRHIITLLVTAVACVLVGGWLFALSQDLPGSRHSAIAAAAGSGAAAAGAAAAGAAAARRSPWRRAWRP